jgi:hypothetical protein
MALERFDLDLHRVEEEALAATIADPGALLGHYVIKLVNRVRELDHELNHPNYTYASGRIGRSALVYRNQEIERLREQVKKLTKPECKVPPKGWKCTRGAGHEGPCAAVPN